MTGFKIHPELAGFMPSNSNEEELRASIKKTGGVFSNRRKIYVCRVDSEDPFAIFLIDGHTSERICREEGLPFQPAVEFLHFRTLAEALEWMREFQDSQRNMTPEARVARDLLFGLEPRETTECTSGMIARAREIFEKDPQKLELVREGRVTLQVAHNFLFKPTRPGPGPAKAKPRKLHKTRVHFVIGDTQVKPDVPTAHLRWIGQYIVDKFANKPQYDLAIIHVGDHWDFPSLSSYDEGTKAAEGRRVQKDIDAGNEGFRLLNAPLAEYNAKLPQNKQWWPERHFLRGNHEDRLARYINANAELDGALSFAALDTCGWQVHGFLDTLNLDGIAYAHYFKNKMGKPSGGENMLTRIKNAGHSFTQGHQQGFAYANHTTVGGDIRHGLVIGSAYLHDEEYLGVQGNTYKRGIVVCNDVKDGDYDVAFISLKYLCKKYERCTLEEFLAGDKAA